MGYSLDLVFFSSRDSFPAFLVTLSPVIKNCRDSRLAVELFREQLVIVTGIRSGAAAQTELHPCCIERYRESARDQSSAAGTENSMSHRLHRSNSGLKREMGRTIPGEFVDRSRFWQPIY